MTYCCVSLNGVFLNTVQFDCLKHYLTTHLGNGSTLDDVPQEKDLERHEDQRSMLKRTCEALRRTLPSTSRGLGDTLDVSFI